MALRYLPVLQRHLLGIHSTYGRSRHLSRRGRVLTVVGSNRAKERR